MHRPHLNLRKNSYDKYGYLEPSNVSGVWFHGTPYLDEIENLRDFHPKVRSKELYASSNKDLPHELSRFWLSDDYDTALRFSAGGNGPVLAFKVKSRNIFDRVTDDFVNCVFERQSWTGRSYFSDVAGLLIKVGFDPNIHDPKDFLSYEGREAIGWPSNFSEDIDEEELMSHFGNLISDMEYAFDPLDECIGLYLGEDLLTLFTESQVKLLIRRVLESEIYCAFEQMSVLTCLLDNGYTGYREWEQMFDSHGTQGKSSNIAIFAPDFDSLELVGVAVRNRFRTQIYTVEEYQRMNRSRTNPTNLDELYASDMQMVPYEHGSAFRSNDYQMRDNPRWRAKGELPPTFTSDAMGTLKNPLSDSGTSWWHITSPYNPDIERYGFLIPSYFMSDLNSGCVMAEVLGRKDPLTVYEVAIRIKPENLMCPQTIFKDWLPSWHSLYREDEYGSRWYFDARDNRPNPWFSRPEFIETLTDLGKSFYHEIASKCDVYSAASVMSLVCECDFIIFDILKNMTDPSFEGWCIRNEIYGWIEVESRDEGWVQDPSSGMWRPEGGFNIGVWETSKIRIREVFKDAVDCDELFLEPWKAIGRKNPYNTRGDLIVEDLDEFVKVYHSTDAVRSLINGFDTEPVRQRIYHHLYDDHSGMFVFNENALWPTVRWFGPYTYELLVPVSMLHPTTHGGEYPSDEIEAAKSAFPDSKRPVLSYSMRIDDGNLNDEPQALLLGQIGPSQILQVYSMFSDTWMSREEFIEHVNQRGGG